MILREKSIKINDCGLAPSIISSNRVRKIENDNFGATLVSLYVKEVGNNGLNSCLKDKLHQCFYLFLIFFYLLTFHKHKFRNRVILPTTPTHISTFKLWNKKSFRSWMFTQIYIRNIYIDIFPNTYKKSNKADLQLEAGCRGMESYLAFPSLFHWPLLWLYIRQFEICCIR